MSGRRPPGPGGPEPFRRRRAGDHGLENRDLGDPGSARPGRPAVAQQLARPRLALRASQARSPPSRRSRNRTVRTGNGITDAEEWACRLAYAEAANSPGASTGGYRWAPASGPALVQHARRQRGAGGAGGASVSAHCNWLLPTSHLSMQACSAVMGVKSACARAIRARTSRCTARAARRLGPVSFRKSPPSGTDTKCPGRPGIDKSTLRDR